MAFTTNEAAIANYLGQYYSTLMLRALNGLDFLPQVRVIRNVSGNGLMMPKLTVKKGIRPLNLDVESDSRNNREFSGRILKVYGGMKIVTIIPEELFKTWMDKGMDPNAKELPIFAADVWNGEFDMIKSEINDSIYLGVAKASVADWATGSTYTGGTDYVNFLEDIYKCVTTTSTGQSPATHPAKWLKVNESVISEGWGTIIAREIADSNLTGNNVVSTGALTIADAYDQLQDMYKAMPVAHKKLGGVFLMNPDNFLTYKESYVAKFPNSTSRDSGDEPMYIFGSGKKWAVEEATWMGDSGRVIANARRSNLLFGTSMEADMSKAGKIIETLHGQKTAIKWRQGCEFADLEVLYVNDQA